MKRGVYIILMSVFIIQLGHAQFKFGKVDDAIVKQNEHHIDKDASAAVVYRKTNTTFNYTEDKGFFRQTEFHEIIKIYNSEGHDWATVEIPMYVADKSQKEQITGLKAYTYNVVDGKVERVKLEKSEIFDEERSKYRDVKKFTMPNIQDGAVIEYTYKFISPFISNIDEFKFQETIPVDKVEMKFYAPEYMNYRTHGKGWIPLNIKNDNKNRTLRLPYKVEREGGKVITQGSFNVREVQFQEIGYFVNLKDIPAIKKEAYSGNIKNYMSGLQFELAFTKYPGGSIENYATTWEDVVKKIYKSPAFGKELSKVNYFKNELSPIINKYSTQEEKMLAIYEYVRRNFSWNEYIGVYTDQGVAKTFKEKIGSVADINLMLTAMLRYAGIDANPILLSTKANGIPIYPTRTGFNYVISGAIINGGVVLLDGTDKTGNINILKSSLLNWQGRMIKKDGSSSVVNVIPSKPAIHTAMLSMNFDDDFMLSGTAQNRYTGHYAKEMRNTFVNLGDDQTLKEIEEDLDGAEASDISFKELKNVYKPLSTSFTIADMEAVEVIEDKIYFSPGLYLCSLENDFKTEDRQYPVDFNYPRQSKYIITIDIPDGYAVESLPDPIAINLDKNIGSFRYQISENAGKLQLSLQKNISVALVSPTYYADLKNFFKVMVEKESEKVVLKKI